MVCVCLHTHTHTHNGILPSHKQNEILPFATTWINLEGIMLREVSQTEKDKYCMFSLHVESNKSNKQMNLTKQKQIHKYREQTSGYQ